MNEVSKEVIERMKAAGYTESHSSGLTIIYAPSHVVVAAEAVPAEAWQRAYDHYQHTAHRDEFR